MHQIQDAPPQATDEQSDPVAAHRHRYFCAINYSPAECSTCMHNRQDIRAEVLVRMLLWCS